MSDRAPVPIGNGFAADYRVRFDEAGPGGLVRTSTLLRYAQDVAWRHSEDRGFDRSWYAGRGLNWVVRGVELDVLRPIGLGETLRLSTAVVGHRRIWARRLAEARAVSPESSVGEPAARIVTDWVILDGRGRPVRIPTDFGLGFASPELRSDIIRVDQATGPPAASTRIWVRPQELDPVGHVNNAAYLDWLEEALVSTADERDTALDRTPRSVRLEYLASAGPGEEVEITTWRDGPHWHARITRGGGEAVLRGSGLLR